MLYTNRKFDEMETSFSGELNEAIKKGTPTPKSNHGELVPIVSPALHVVKSKFRIVSNNVQVVVPEKIDLDTLEVAIYFVDCPEQSKDLFVTICKFNLTTFSSG